jgi:hypothetical protein
MKEVIDDYVDALEEVGEPIAAALLVLAAAVAANAAATREIAGGGREMGGLEALAVAIAGRGLAQPLGEAVIIAGSSIGDAILAPHLEG